MVSLSSLDASAYSIYDKLNVGNYYCHDALIQLKKKVADGLACCCVNNLWLIALCEYDSLSIVNIGWFCCLNEMYQQQLFKNSTIVIHFS